MGVCWFCIERGGEPPMWVFHYFEVNEVDYLL